MLFCVIIVSLFVFSVVVFWFGVENEIIFCLPLLTLAVFVADEKNCLFCEFSSVRKTQILCFTVPRPWRWIRHQRWNYRQNFLKQFAKDSTLTLCKILIFVELCDIIDSICILSCWITSKTRQKFCTKWIEKSLFWAPITTHNSQSDWRNLFVFDFEKYSQSNQVKLNFWV